MKAKNTNEKKEIILGVLIALGVLTTMYFYLMEAGNAVLVVIVLALVALAMYIIWDRVKSMRKGLPARDERLTNINYKAGYYAFIAAIWSAVFAGPLIGDFILGRELGGGDVTGIVVLVSGFAFVLSYLYMARKGG